MLSATMAFGTIRKSRGAVLPTVVCVLVTLMVMGSFGMLIGSVYWMVSL